MATEDLLVNIDIETKPAKRGVDDLNKSLKENAKQTKAIEKELMKLEKEYKSIGTAIKKIPTKDVSKLNKEVRKTEKATRNVNAQFEKTTKKLKVVEERTTGATDAFAALGVAVLSFKNFKPIIGFSTQMVNATQSILAFQKNTVPIIRDTIDGLGKGFKQVSRSVKDFKEAFKLVGPAVKEQVKLLQGYHIVQKNTILFNDNLRTGLQRLSSGFSFFQRRLSKVNEFTDAASEGFTRVVRVFKTLGGALKTTTKVIGGFQKAWFGTFGAGTAGAAQINKWQQLMLDLQFRGEMAGKAIRESFARVSTVVVEATKKTVAFIAVASKDVLTKVSAGAAGASKNIATLALQLGKVAAAGGLNLARKGIELLREPVKRVMLGVQGLNRAFKEGLGKAMAQGTISMAKLGSSMFNMSKSMGILNAGLLSTVGKMSKLGVAFVSLGSVLKSTDSLILDTVGSAIQLAGILSLSLVSGISIVTGLLGTVMVAAGNKLLGVMDKLEQKFVKVQKITKAFEFTVRGFGKTMGEEAVGSIAFWGKTVDEITQKTAFSAEEIQKAIKILIAEGSLLKITSQQNVQLLKRTADIAALTGAKFEDVALAIAKGLAGNTGSLQTYGIFLDNATLSHSEFIKKMGVTVESLGKAEKAQLAMNVLLDQTTPIVGAAASELDTVAGSTKKYNSTLNTLLAKLGSQAQIFTDLTNAQSMFLGVLDKLPAPVFDVISTFIDLGGIVLKVTGYIMGLTTTLISIQGIWSITSALVARVTFVQLALGTAINMVRTSIGLQAVAITSLGSGMRALGQTIVPMLIASFKSFIGIVTAAALRVKAFTVALLLTRAGWLAMAQGALLAAASVAKFTLAVLTNPLFIKVAVITAGIYGLVKAFQELKKELSFLAPVMETVSDSTGKTTKNLKEQISIFKSLGSGFLKFFKIIVIGWLKIIELVKAAGVGYQILWEKAKGLFTDTSKAMIDLSQEFMGHIDALVELDNAYENTFDPLKFSAFNHNVKLTKLAVRELAGEVKGYSGALKLSSDMQNKMNVEILGDEVDRANVKFQEATRLLNTLRDIGVIKVGAEIIMPTTENLAKLAEGTLTTSGGDKVKGSPIAAAEEGQILEATLKAEAARLALVKIRQDSLKDINKALGEQHLRTLERSGREIEAIRARGAQELKVLKEKIAAQNKVSVLSGKELAQFKKLERAIRATIAADIVNVRAKQEAKALEDVNKRLGVVRSLEKAYAKLNQEVLGGSGDVIGAEKIKLALQLLQVDALEESLSKQEEFLDSQGRLKKAYKETLDEARKLAKEKFSEFVDAQSFSSKLQSAVEAIPVENFGGRFAKSMLVGGIEASRELNDVVSGIRKGMDAVAAMDIGGTFKKAADSLRSMENPFKGMDIAGIFSKAKDLFNDINFKEIGLSLGTFAAEGLVAGASMVGQMFDPEQINKLGDFFGEFLMKLPEQLISAFKKLDKVLGDFIEKFPELVSSLMEALPGLISGIIEKIPMIIDAFVEGFTIFIDKLPALLTMIFDALPGIITKLMEALPGIILQLLEAVGTIVAQFIKAFPDMVVAFIEGIPDIVLALVEGLISAMGEIVAAFIDFLIGGGLERIFVAVMKVIPKIAVALVKGIVNGLKKAAGKIFGGIKAPEALEKLPEKFSKGIKDLAKNTTKEASKLFKIMDLEDAALGIPGGIQGGPDVAGEMMQVGKAISGIWDKFLGALKRVWMWIWEKVLEPIVKIVKKAWIWVYDRIILPMLSAIKSVWQAVARLLGSVWDGVLRLFEGVVNLLKSVWSVAVELLRAWANGLKAVVVDAFEIVQKLWEGFSNTVKEAFKVVQDIFDGLKEGVKGAFKIVTDLFDNLKDIVSTAFKEIKDFFTNIFKENIAKAFSGIFETFDTIGSKIWGGLKKALLGGSELYAGIGKSIWDALSKGLEGLGSIFTDAVSGIGDAVKKAIEAINPENLFNKIFDISGSKGKGTVETALNIDVPFVNFATGGVVPGSSLVPGDSELNDRILAMISPGEAVIPRSKMKDPAIAGIVQDILKGKLELPKFYSMKDLKRDVGGAAGTVKEIVAGVTEGSNINFDSIDFGSLNPANIDFRKLSTENFSKTLTQSVDAAWKGVESGVGALKKMVGDLGLIPSLEAMSSSIMREVKKAVMNIFESNKFHNGGLVGGGSEVPAMLQGGEFVMSRQAVRGMGLGTISQMNRGGMQPNQEFNFDIQMDVRADNLPDEAFVRQRMVPVMKRELKDASIRGEFLLSNKGIRET